MPRPRIGSEPLTPTERSARRRERNANETTRLRDALSTAIDALHRVGKAQRVTEARTIAADALRDLPS